MNVSEGREAKDVKKKGYPVEVLGLSTSECVKLVCILCHLVLRDPVQNICGHRFCQDCHQSFLSEVDNRPCPQCEVEEENPNERKRIKRDGVFKDKAFTRDWRNVQVACRKSGCTWQGPLHSYENHEDVECNGILVVEEQGEARVDSGHAAPQPQVGDAVNLRNEPDGQGENGNVALLARSVLRSTDFMMELRRQAARLRTSVTERRTRINELEAKKKTLERRKMLQDVRQANLAMRIQQVDSVSYDGELLWLVEGFGAQLMNAKTGSMACIQSPLFFASRTGSAGYKLCARMYLNGNGIGQNTHISLFIALLRGNFDAVLHWPFTQTVKLTIIDQAGQGHVVKVLHPDPASPSFERPKEDRNKACGFAQFMPLAHLFMSDRAYVREDCMIVRVVVDTRGIYI